MSDKLLPCPFCGKTETLRVVGSESPDNFTVNCDAGTDGPGGCGAVCGYGRTKMQAIRNWNVRAHPEARTGVHAATTKKYEYKTNFVSRYYPGLPPGEQCPETDCLKAAGDEGWILCAVGAPDSGGTKKFYFYKEVS